MIKRFSIRKISKYTILLLVVFLFYLFPKKDNYVISKDVSFNKDVKKSILKYFNYYFNL